MASFVKSFFQLIRSFLINLFENELANEPSMSCEEPLVKNILPNCTIVAS